MTADAQIAYLLAEWLDAPRQKKIAAGVLIEAIRGGEDVVAHCYEIAGEVRTCEGSEAAEHIVYLCDCIR